MHPPSTARSRAAARLPTLLLVSLLLTACASNPLVSWQPGLESSARLDTMARARADAEALKQAFQAKAEAYVENKVRVNDALLGLGILTLGLGAAGAHRDAYTVTAGLAGSTYFFGNTHLQQPMLDAYMSGIGAVNCALAAVKPVQISDDDLRDVDTRATALRPLLVKLAEAIANAQAALAIGTNLAPALVSAANDQLESARAVYRAAAAANADSGLLPDLVAKAANGLKGALSRIHLATNKAAASGVLDSTAVLESLKALSGVITAFGKAQGVDVLKQAADGKSSAGTAQSLDGDNAPSTAVAAEEDKSALRALSSALTQLARAEADAAAVGAPLASRLVGYKTYDNGAELAKCQIDVSTSALAVSKGTLTFTASITEDQGARFTAHGGTKPYRASFIESPTGGIEVVNPLGFDSTFEVKVPKTVAAGRQLTLVVSDGASPPAEVPVTVKVVAASGNTAGAGNENQSLSGTSALDVSLKAAKANGGRFTVGTGSRKLQFQVVEVKRDSGFTQVKLACTPPAKPAPATRAAVRDALLQLLTSAYRLSDGEAAAIRANASRLMLVSDPACLQ